MTGRTVPQVTTIARPAGASVPTDAADHDAPRGPLTGAVEVLADKSGRVGLLSYLVPDTLTVQIGDAVAIPFGTQTKHGMVTGPATDPGKATKHILEVFGKRADPRDVHLARTIAKYHFADLTTVLGRLSPTKGRGADPLVDTAVEVADVPRPYVHGVGGAVRRLLIRAPLVNSAHLAAHEAARIARASNSAQVLVLCPTTAVVTAVAEAFSSGAQRLDSRARQGAWKGFTSGTVRIGVGTRRAALYSAANLAGIIVVDEDHPGHIEAAQPHTHARDIANARARALGIPLTLISANPTPVALGAGVQVGTAGTRADWPTMRLIDRGQIDPVQRWVPPQLKAAIASENKAGRTPVIVAQRRAAIRRCARCGTPRPCPLCDTSLCRHQDTDPCPTCASTDPARMVGWDADRISDALVGAQTSGRKQRGIKVKVVTVADLPKHRNAGLVVLFDIDAALSIPEYIPQQFGTSLIVTAAQVAGPGGQVLALTDTPDTAALADLFGPRDQKAVARRALSSAQAANLPPFGRLVTVRTARNKPPRTAGWPGHVLGPQKVAGEWELIVRINAADLLDLERPLARLRRGGKVRVTVT